MKLEAFDYHLPKDLIAQSPSPSRDASRMMVIDRRKGLRDETVFNNLPDFLRKGDCLVLNDSKVIPARLIGKKESGGEVEILLLAGKKGEGLSGQIWEVLLRPAKRIQPGMFFRFGDEAWAEVVRRISDKKWLLRFATGQPFNEFLERNGRTPLPPYIRRKGRTEEERDRVRYQTVYAKAPGSIAAPTAGLHFTEQILARLQDQGVTIATVTLHVGYGTFLPLEKEIVEDHVMEEEFFEVNRETADAVNRAGRVIAVGTTSTRVLESVADESGRIHPASGYTDLFIYPGYCFKRVDGMITNFHLPRSSLLVLVCAFAGRALILKAYARAVEAGYRFYSYGDSMLIL